MVSLLRLHLAQIVVGDQEVRDPERGRLHVVHGTRMPQKTQSGRPATNRSESGSRL